LNPRPGSSLSLDQTGAQAQLLVTPAKERHPGVLESGAGVQFPAVFWIPAFAGMTEEKRSGCRWNNGQKVVPNPQRQRYSDVRLRPATLGIDATYHLSFDSAKQERSIRKG
jgi:hypothetical protein